MTNPARRSHDSTSERGGETLPPPVGGNRDLLDKILHETLALSKASVIAAPTEMSALRQVAARHPDQKQINQPIAVELVQAVLPAAWATAVSAEQWPAMTANIAQSLLEDPASRSRLQDLWSRLAERAT